MNSFNQNISDLWQSGMLNFRTTPLHTLMGVNPIMVSWSDLRQQSWWVQSNLVGIILILHRKSLHPINIFSCLDKSSAVSKFYTVSFNMRQDLPRFLLNFRVLIDECGPIVHIVGWRTFRAIFWINSWRVHFRIIGALKHSLSLI